jgi:hypothetical protein
MLFTSYLYEICEDEPMTLGARMDVLLVPFDPSG